MKSNINVDRIYSIKCHDSDAEYWRAYNDDGNWINYADSYGRECSTEYDDFGNVIYQTREDLSCWMEYDSNNSIIHYTNSNGSKEWYGEEGNKISNCIGEPSSSQITININGMEYMLIPKYKLNKEIK